MVSPETGQPGGGDVAVPGTEREPSDPYAPYLDVPVVDVRCFLPASSQTQQAQGSNDGVSEEKKAVAKRIARCSMEFGSFWVDLGGASEISAESSVPFCPSSWSSAEFTTATGSRQHDSTLSQTEILSACQQLFCGVNEEKKKELTNVKLPGSKIERGYIAYGSESGDKNMFENKEGFGYGYGGWRNGNNNDQKSESKPSFAKGFCPCETHDAPQFAMEGYNVFPEIKDGFGEKVRLHNDVYGFSSNVHHMAIIVILILIAILTGLRIRLWILRPRDTTSRTEPSE